VGSKDEGKGESVDGRRERTKDKRRGCGTRDCDTV
jgi:hypothetical protein